MRIVELKLLTRDVPAVGRFYARTLGLPTRSTSSHAVTVGIGRTAVTFARAAPGHAPSYHFAFNVAENAFDDACEWIASRAQLLSDADQETFHFDSWNADAVYFQDPAGNIVELIARHGLDNARRGPFGPTFLTGVSEVGLPVADVSRAVRFLGRTLESHLYGSSRDSFAALGDEHGLLILVGPSHRWMPIGRPVARHPIAMTVEADRDACIDVPGAPYRISTRAVAR